MVSWRPRQSLIPRRQTCPPVAWSTPATAHTMLAVSVLSLDSLVRPNYLVSFSPFNLFHQKWLIQVPTSESSAL